MENGTNTPRNHGCNSDASVMEAFGDAVRSEREKRLEIIANQRHEHQLRIRELEQKSELHKKVFLRKRTNFGWMETCNKGPNKWGKKINN